VFPNPVYPEAGIALSTGSAWASSIPNNSANWNIAFNDKITNAAFTGTTTKTLTLTQYDGGTFTPTFTDLQGIVAADTASMLTPYLRRADTSSLNLTSRFAAKLNISDTASMLTNYLRSGVAASTYLPLTGGILSGSILNSWSSASSSAPRNDGAVRRTYTQNLYSANGNTSDRVTHYYTFSQDECCASAPVTMYYGRFNGFYNQSNIIYDASIYYHNNNQFYYRAFSEPENKVTFSIKASTTVNTIDGTKADLYLSGDAQIDRSLNIGTTLGVTGATTLGSTLAVTGNITEGGNNVLTNLDTVSLSSRIDAKLNISDTASMLTPYLRRADTSLLNLTSRFAAKLNISDTTLMLTPYLRKADTSLLNLTSRFAAKQNTLISAVNIKTLNGTSLLGSGDISISSGNISGGGTGNYIPLFSGSTSIANSPIFKNTLNTQLKFESYGLTTDKRITTFEYFTMPITISTNCGSPGGANLIGTGTGNYVNNCSTGTAYLLLPDPSNTLVNPAYATGRMITITNLRSDQSIVLNTSGSYINARPLGINGSEESSIPPKRWITVQSNGTNWYIIATGSAL